METNPKNFYGLRDVDELAGLIAISHLIEPLTVSKQENGKYMLISGHRRRAAVQKLLEEGIYTERITPKEQNACLEKILSGKMKDTVEAIQKWKLRQKETKEREEEKNPLKAEQYAIRASVVSENIEELKKSVE